MASTVSQNATNSVSFKTTILSGVIAGLVGGLVFGMMMAMMSMLPMVAMLIGSDNVVVGFMVHMVISAVIGASYGFIAPRLPSSWMMTIGAGIVYGVIWWVLGALVIMPLALGMGQMVLQIGDMQWLSLMGHIIFGVIMAAVYKWQVNRN